MVSLVDAAEFQQRLLEECELQGLTHERDGVKKINVYALGRLMNPVNPWTAERVIRRWLREENPTMPSEESRRSLALVLGRPPDFFVVRGLTPRQRKTLGYVRGLVRNLDLNREGERVA